jgi:hypothetical protein
MPNASCCHLERDPGATGTSEHLEHKVFKSLGEGLKRMGEAADEANLLKCKEIKL